MIIFIKIHLLFLKKFLGLDTKQSLYKDIRACFNIVETELLRISTQHSFLDNLIKKD